MTVFVHEFITSGALADAALPPSLLREGTAMLRAAVVELLHCRDVRVVTTRDERVPAFGCVSPRSSGKARDGSQANRLNTAGLTEIAVSDVGSEWTHFRRLCAKADRCLVIAPELGGELRRRVAAAVEIAGRARVLNSPELVEVASDKWATFRRLKGAGVPTIETCLGSSGEWRRWGRVVVKPRDGAGSQGVRLVEAGLGDGLSLTDEVVVQPFLWGRWLSCGMVFFPGGRPEVFPPAEQRIAEDGSFAYLGGVMPADCDRGRVQELAVSAVCALADAAEHVGVVGVDLVEDAASGEVLVCEVNPRLTTSFVAASRLGGFGVLRGLIDPMAERIAWTDGGLRFDAGGVVEPL